MHHSVFSASNKLTLLNCGKDFFPALIAALDGAQHEIYLETYIFFLDETGESVLAALQRAAARKVVTRLVIDWVGSGRTNVALIKEGCAASGIQVRIFNPWCRRGITRTHRKMCAVDQQIAFVGGINITDDMYTDNASHTPLPAPRWDFAVRIEGPLVGHAEDELKRQWRRLGHIGLRERWSKFKRDRANRKVSLKAPVLAALVIRDNVRNRRTIQRATMKALGHARETALIANPYFAPGRSLRRALEMAAQRGVEVSLMLGVGHYPVQDAVTQWYYPKLLAAGVRIFEYRHTALHAKVAVIDHHWATVGSSNYDGFSLLVNQEANVVVKDDAFALTLEADIRAGLTQATEVRVSDLRRQSAFQRGISAVAFYSYRMIMRIMTLGTRSR